MRWHVDAWDPGYGAAFDAEPGPSQESSAQVDTDVERPAAAWEPVAPAAVPVPDVVFLVDGVRRLDATLWSTEDDGSTYPAQAASYAAGVVRCDLRSGGAAVVEARVDRGLFTASPSATDLVAGSVTYRRHEVRFTDPMKLRQAVQGPLTALEVDVSNAARRLDSGADLLVVDGPLRRRNLPRTVGYVKTQQGRYLSSQLSTVVTRLAPGWRCPVFRVGTAWGAYTWYLRLPCPRGAPWTGIVRVECSLDLTAAEAVALADTSTVTLPRFASSAYKDPRAPQNLVPVGGLEKRLRAMLGDARLLHRALVARSATAAGPAAVTVSG